MDILWINFTERNKSPVKRKNKLLKIKSEQLRKWGGGEENEIFTLDTANSISKLYDFIQKKFLNTRNIHRSSFNEIKKDIISKISKYITRRQTEPKTEREREIREWDIVNIFYIYDSSNNKIISLGIITPNYESRRNNRKTIIYGRGEYLYIKYLLSRTKGGGISALYHLLLNLPLKYSGICLHPLRNLKEEYYQKLGFIEYSSITGCIDDDLHILDKTQKNIRRLEDKLPHPITTKFYSTYPNTEFYPIYPEPDIHQLNTEKNTEKNTESLTNKYSQSTNIIENRRKPVGMPQTLNQYWNPDKQNWVRPNYSRIEKKSRNEIARELLRRKFMSKNKWISSLFLLINFSKRIKKINWNNEKQKELFRNV